MDFGAKSEEALPNELELDKWTRDIAEDPYVCDEFKRSDSSYADSGANCDVVAFVSVDGLLSDRERT